MKTIDISYIKSILDYDPATGAFKWKSRDRNSFSSERIYKSWNAQFSGKPCGCLTNKYLAIRIKGTLYYCHRLAWVIHYGKWPESDVDHINMVKTDNRISNLRLGSRGQNMANMRATKANKSGFIGVHWAKREGKWVSSITIDHKFKFLGYYDDPVSAAKAYNEECAKIHGDFAKKKIEHNLSQIQKYKM